jgi:hypothetical protein
MNKETVRATYDYYSGKQSDIIRQVGLAGIAVIWIFKEGEDKAPSIALSMRWAAGLILASLAFDLLQYVAGSLIWGVYLRKLDQKATAETKQLAPSSKINWPTLFFFWTKLPLMVAAYVIIILYLANKFVT